MIRITISTEAYTFMAATLPGNVGIERQRAQNGDVYIWLDPGIVNRLNALRRPGESYSDVILRLATAQRKRPLDRTWRSGRERSSVCVSFLSGRGMDRSARFSPGEGAAPDGRQLRGCGRACAG